MPPNGTIDFNAPIAATDLSGSSDYIALLSFLVPIVKQELSGAPGTLGTFNLITIPPVVEVDGTSLSGASINFTTKRITAGLSGTSYAPGGTLGVTSPSIALSISVRTNPFGTVGLATPIIDIEFIGHVGDAVYRAMVLNTETLAITEYDNFPFNSFCEHGGNIYGATSDGIYLLGGDKDGSDEIDAYYKTAITDFGTSNLKQCLDIVSRFKGERLKVSVLDDREEVQTEEVLTGHAPVGVHTERSKPGKGLKSAALGLDIENVNGSDFEPLGHEMRVVLLDRKVR